MVRVAGFAPERFAYLGFRFPGRSAARRMVARRLDVAALSGSRRCAASISVNALSAVS
jgi:hypothetical protein